MEKTASASGATSRVGYPTDVVKVLAVDEDPLCLINLTRMLQRCGYQVTAKASPEEALREVRQNPEGSFDLVITVAHTEGTGINGFGLLQHLRNSHPVILVSDDEPVAETKGWILLGACDLLTKPLREEELRHIWQHVSRWRLNAANGSDSRKRGSAGAVNGSGEGGSRGVQQQQKQCRTARKNQLASSPGLHASFVEAAELLRGTEGYCPIGIRELLAAQGVEITIEQATCHLEIYERHCLTNDLSPMNMSTLSHYNNSKDYSMPGSSSGSYMRSQGATNINQARLLGNGASTVGHGALGNESYRPSHVGHLHNNGSHHGNANGYDNHYGNSGCNGIYSNGYGHHYGNGNCNGDGNGNCNGNGNANAPGYYGNGAAGLPGNGSTVGSSLLSNQAQQVQQAMPPAGLFPRLSYNSRSGGLTMSPWHVDDGDDLLRRFLGENEVMQNTAHTHYFSWQNTNGNRTTGASDGM